MFSQVYVILFTGGVYHSMHWGRHLPGRHPPGQTSPPLMQTHTPLGRHPPCPVHAGIHTPCPVHAGIHPTPSGHCSVRYASYWNAFLFFKNNLTQNSYYVISTFVVFIFISENLPNSAPKISSSQSNPRRSDTDTMDVIFTALSVLLFDS